MVRSSPESMETEKERDRQLQQSCDNTIQIQEPHSSRVPLKGEAVENETNCLL